MAETFEITIVDKDNLPLPAFIMQDGKGVNNANIDGQVKLTKGNYTAKMVGYSDTPFSVSGDSYVLMKDSGTGLTSAVEIVGKARNPYRKWFILGGVAILLSGAIYFLSKKQIF